MNWFIFPMMCLCLEFTAAGIIPADFRYTTAAFPVIRPQNPRLNCDSRTEVKPNAEK